jgi:S-DNA-T family DNA segregation ATPase FtsK/SpoIIIE
MKKDSKVKKRDLKAGQQNRRDLWNQIFGVLLISLSLLMVVSLASHSPEDPPNSSRPPELAENLAGWIGGHLSYYMLFVVGYAAYVVAVLVFLWGWNRFRRSPVIPLVGPTMTLLTLVVLYCGATGVPSRGRTYLAFRLGGWLGVTLSSALLVPYLGRIGSYIFLGTALVVLMMVVTNIPFSRIPDLVVRSLQNVWNRGWLIIGGVGIGLKSWKAKFGAWRRARAIVKQRRAVEKEEAVQGVPLQEPEEVLEEDYPEEVYDEEPVALEEEPWEPVDEEETVVEPEIVLPPSMDISKGSNGLQIKHPADVAYTLPDLNLLDEPHGKDEGPDRETLLAGAQILEQSLNSFGIEGKVAQVNPGPVITGYEVQPPRGVKVNRIVNLADDLALVMKARSIRIQAPIPGKAAVGIEVPNPKPSTVFLKEILQSTAFQNSDDKLMLALGKSATGEPICTNLAAMPHLLIAGATGAGKSVCINALVTSILVRCRPDEVRFIMVDPKMLELSVYNKIPHLLAPVVTEPKKASEALKWAVSEMEERYRTMSRYGVRNIMDFNKKLDRMRDAAESEEDKADVPPRLPYIVIVIDELADLMMTAPADIEDSLARLAQMARAVGIHLILATQRPSVNVITGTIKANFPSRIAFRVASKVDSRTILDCNGAEKLLGRGDMLFSPAGKPEPFRVHGANISTEETERLVEWVSGQGVALDGVDLGEDANSRLMMDNSRDERFDEAMKLVISHQQGSASLLQRRMKVGYARAARLVDELEEAGVVGPSDGSSKGREVLVDESFLERMAEDEYDSV